MAHGYTGTILRVNLNDGTIARSQPSDRFYRTYLGGSAFGTYFLLKEGAAKAEPLSPDNVLTISPGVTTGAPVSGVSRCAVTALSPATGAVGDSQVGGRIGPDLKKAGFDAVVISGRADSLQYLLIDGDEVSLKNAEHLRGQTILETHDSLVAELGKGITVLQCGPAGEKLVRFACLLADLNDSAGRTGMGAVFGSKNLRAVVVRGKGAVPMADSKGLTALAKQARERLPHADFPRTLNQYGTPGVVGFQAEAGNLATHNYSRSYHEDYKQLDGETIDKLYGAGDSTCPGCVVRCRKKVKIEGGQYEVGDRLGGPEFETLGLLGSNLDITDPAAVAKANELCNDYGIDTISMGGLAAYLFESAEEGLISTEQTDGVKLGFGDAEALIWLIEKVVAREGVGDVVAEGFLASIAHFGKETEKYAIHVKNNGLAVHMAQVKPSQALTFAVCPIGPDHMSAEHDWLLPSDSEESKGLGIVGEGAFESTGAAKVRATVYSQYYYSLLDTLTLCMFCFGPGNLFTYRDVEDLLKCTTGWDMTFYELMKAGERRVNLMRKLNALRGFTRADDRLPDRLGEPIPDGPKQGSQVSKETLERMIDQYYGMMGWDLVTGNPTAGKLLELGLDWIDNPTAEENKG